MKLKTLLLVVAILAALSLAAYYLQRPSAPVGADPRTNQPLLDSRILDKTARIRIAEQGKTVVLARQPDGSWIVPAYYDLPADFSKLGHFIDDLSAAKVQRLATQNPGRLARLEFKDASVALLDPAGHPLWTLTLGREAEGGGRFVRFDDEKKGYLASLNLFLDSTPKNWADTLLIDVKPDDIAGVEIAFADGAPVVATRAKKEDAWASENAPSGQRIKGERVTSLLSSFSSLRFQDTSDLSAPDVDAAHKRSRTVRLTTFDHKILTVELGRNPEEKIADAAKAAKNAPAAVASPAENAPATGETAAGNSSPAVAVLPAEKPGEAKPETIPAGPVYAFITSSDAGAAINALMKKRAFQIYDWSFTGLPQKRDELFEPLPVPPPAEMKPVAAPEKADGPGAAPSPSTTK